MMSVSSLGLVVLLLLPLTCGQNASVTTSGSETSPPASSTTFLPVSQTAATPTDSTTPRYSSTEGRKSTTENPFNSSASAATTAATGDAGDRTRTTPPTATASSSAQTPSTDEAATQPPTRPTPSTSLNSTTNTSTSLNSTTNTSTGPVESKTAATSPVAPATRPPGSHTTRKKASVYTAKATETRPGNKNKEKAGKGPVHGWVVAGLIGGALLVMLLGFLLIYVKKRTLRKHQMATGDWAGPSPFLEGGEGVAMRSSNRISLSSFLTQRLSRRVSALPDAGEELDAMTPASTFGVECGGSRFTGEDGGAEGGGPDAQSNGDAPENNNDIISEGGDLSADPPTVSAEAGNAPAQPDGDAA